jgi:SNF2 family DNA or RNA helicase
MIYLENFTRIKAKQLHLHKEIPDTDLRITYGDHKQLVIIDVNDLLQTEIHNDQYNLWMTPKTTYFDNYVKFQFWNHDYAVYPYLDFRTVDSMKQDKRYISSRNKFTNNSYLNASLIARIEKTNDTYYLVYYINNRIMENINHGKREPKQYLFIELVSQQERENILERMKQELPSIISSCVSISGSETNRSNTILKSNVSLYGYQLDDVNWMSSIERDIINNNNVIRHNHSISARIVNNQFTLLNNNLYPTWLIDETNLNKTTQIVYHGANLVSEVGLGKTLISLYHIINSSNTSYNHFVDYQDEGLCNYFYKRGNLKGQNCKQSTTNNSLFCKSHMKTPFIEKRALHFKNLESFCLEDIIYNDKLKTNASLIVCPNQLCDQWVREYYNKFSIKKRVVLVVTAEQFDNLTIGELLFADIVITSYQFLVNSRYQHYHITNNKLKRSTSNSLFEILNSKRKSFSLFFWDRIMLDEAHEIQNNSKSNQLIDTLSDISSTFRWNITGTPFANGVDSLLHLMQYNTSFKCLAHRKTVHNCTIFDMLAFGVNEKLVTSCKKLFRHNSKESIKNQYAGNQVMSSIKLLDFTNQERSIYNSYMEGNRSSTRFTEFLIKLCCHSELHSETREQIQNCKTFDEIQQVLLQYNKDKIGSLKALLTSLNIMLNAKMVQLEQEQDEQVQVSLRQDIGSLKRSQTYHKNSLDDTERTFNYLKNAIENLNAPDNCPICLEAIPKDNLGITRCGHKFCWDCILHCHNTRGGGNRPFKCPSCNTLMSPNEIYRVVDNENSTTEISTIINRVKSTKIGNIIYYIKNGIQPNDKIILFSQWETLLHKVGDYLRQYKINVVYCNGSIYQRKNAITSFSTDPQVNVILLSSRNSASGINLTAANKVILLEPIYGTKQYRTNIENQIIGRANRIGQNRDIEVVRFIIKDTIEEDIINDNIDESKIRQLSTH